MLSIATKELFEAIDEVNLQKLEKAISDGADINALEGDENTPLMNIISTWATDGNREDAYKSMADLLIKNQNININIQNREQRNTALHLAISFKLTEAVKLLLAHQSIDFSIKNNYQVENYPYPPNRYNDTALEYAKKLGTPKITKEIEREIYRRSTLSDQAKYLLKKAKPYIVKALIVAACSPVLVAIVLECGMLHTLLALYTMIALSFHIYLLKRFILKDVPINSRYHNKRRVLFFGMASLYCFAVLADIVAGNGYFLISQLLFSVGTPLVMFEEVSYIACNIVSVCQSSELIQSAILGYASFFLISAILVIGAMVNSLVSDNFYDARTRGVLSINQRVFFTLLMKVTRSYVERNLAYPNELPTHMRAMILRILDGEQLAQFNLLSSYQQRVIVSAIIIVSRDLSNPSHEASIVNIPALRAALVESFNNEEQVQFNLLNSFQQGVILAVVCTEVAIDWNRRNTSFNVEAVQVEGVMPQAQLEH